MTAATSNSIVRQLSLALGALAVVIVANLVVLAWATPARDVALGSHRDEYLLSGVHDREQGTDGSWYRWTTARSALAIAHPAVTRSAVLTLRLGGRPTPGSLDLQLDGRRWVSLTATVAPRAYQMLLPPERGARYTLTMLSETFRVAGDGRDLGAKLMSFRVAPLREGVWWPSPAQLGWQLAILLAVQVCLWRLGWRAIVQAGILASLAVGLALQLSATLVFSHAYLPPLAVAAGALAVLTLVGLPAFERVAADLLRPGTLRLIWGMMLVAAALRLAGVLYPGFDGQDLGRNVRRLLLTLGGELVIIAPSSEFARGITIYPTGPYLAAMPLLTLISDLPQYLEGFTALLDGTSVLFVALLARRLGGSERAAMLAATLMLGSVAAFSALYYQFTAQIFGQWFTAPIALVLLAGVDVRPELRRWAWAVLLLQFAMYSHIGVTILAVSWFGTMWVLGARGGRWRAWLAAGALFGGSVALAVVLLYSFILEITLSHAGAVTSRPVDTSGTWFPGASPLMWRGAVLSFSEPGLLVLPVALWLALRPTWAGTRRIVVGGAALVALGYVLVNARFDLQVRYYYFVLPLALALIGIAWAHLARRGRAGLALAGALVLLTAGAGIVQWLGATFDERAISMTPLTH
jgi:hypothetical protein